MIPKMRESWPEIIIYSSPNLTFKDLRPHNEAPSYKVSSVKVETSQVT